MKTLLILIAILIIVLDYLLIVGADERRYNMPTDIYHSEYTRNRHGDKTVLAYTRTHNDANGRDTNSETKTEITDYKNDKEECK